MPNFTSSADYALADYSNYVSKSTQWGPFVWTAYKIPMILQGACVNFVTCTCNIYV